VLKAVVIGAGPAGLAASQQLNRANLQHRVFEQGAAVGHSWRQYYDSLVLHTGKHGSSLPDMPYPKSAPLFPSRKDVIDYLEAYASRFSLPIEFGTVVRGVARNGRGFRIETSRGAVEAKTVIVATGMFSNPYAPEFPNAAIFRGSILHSAEYRRAAPFVSGRTLIVGAGNSGADIAAELAEAGGDVAISIRGGVVTQPLELLGIPLQYWGILLHHLPSPVASGVVELFRQARRRTSRSTELPVRYDPLPPGRVPVIGDRLIRALKTGRARIVPGVRQFERNGVSFADGRAEEFASVILATGYRPAVAFLGNLPQDSPGLFFIGHNNSLAGTLWHVRHEAQRMPAALRRFLD
jgi:cation diffusion facilitator CzcD-associated flavoprotein CzcO